MKYSKPLETFYLQGYEVKKLSEFTPKLVKKVHFHNGHYTEIE